jgi:hypothetical protein
VQIGAGVRIHADCKWGHRNIWESCEFTNKTRTSVIDIMIGVYQLVIGLNMSQVLLWIPRIKLANLRPWFALSPCSAILNDFEAANIHNEGHYKGSALKLRLFWALKCQRARKNHYVPRHGNNRNNWYFYVLEFY